MRPGSIASNKTHYRAILVQIQNLSTQAHKLKIRGYSVACEASLIYNACNYRQRMCQQLPLQHRRASFEDCGRYIHHRSLYPQIGRLDSMQLFPSYFLFSSQLFPNLFLITSQFVRFYFAARNGGTCHNEMQAPGTNLLSISSHGLRLFSHSDRRGK